MPGPFSNGHAAGTIAQPRGIPRRAWPKAGRRQLDQPRSVAADDTPPAASQPCNLAAMPLSRDEAWALLLEWTPGESLRRHARAVELVMRAAAPRYGDAAEVEAWGLAGMLHDADYETWPAEHPHKIVAWLRARGEDAIAHAVSAHYTKWGVAYETALDRALLACDEPTGFVMACCLVRPDGIASLEVGSVKKRLKDKRFAATVDRDEVTAGAALLGVPLDDHLGFLIDALRPHAAELGLAGRPVS
jgi:predicted hydrolase (HD superfamily)